MVVLSERSYVLLVDDNEATCALLTAVLRRDFSVDVANDGDVAIERLKNTRYVAVLLDLKMPRRDGYEVLDFLRLYRPDLLASVIVVTAALSAADVDRVKQYPIADVVRKPFDVERLLRTVSACAERARLTLS